MPDTRRSRGTIAEFGIVALKWGILRRLSVIPLVLAALTTVLLAYSGLVLHPGLHDNDWPLLMWLARQASTHDLAPLAIGHYGPVQLVLVKLLWPAFGSTLAVAKLLNAVAGGAAAWWVHRLVRRATGDGRVGVVAMLAFVLSREALGVGQSEYGDGLALWAWLIGLEQALFAEGPRARLVAGLCMGLAAATRLHFGGFGMMTVAVLVLHALLEQRRRAAVELALLGGLGFVVGQLPATAVYYLVHGQLSSPVAGTFLPQVIMGVDDLDLPGTFRRYTTAEVLRTHGDRVVMLILQRWAELPRRWLPALLVVAVGLVVAPRATRLRAAVPLLLFVGYYTAVVGPSFWFTTRVMLTLVLLLALALALVLPSLRARWPRGAWAAVAVVLVLRLAGEVSATRADLAVVDARWAASTALSRVLRAGGLARPEQAFTLAWDRVQVDDPTLVSYYNFGFWNLLVPSFAAERPSPLPQLQDPAAFSSFLRARGVRFVVVPDDMDRAPWIRTVATGTATLPGFERYAVLPHEVVLRATGPDGP